MNDNNEFKWPLRPNIDAILYVYTHMRLDSASPAPSYYWLEEARLLTHLSLCDFIHLFITSICACII